MKKLAYIANIRLPTEKAHGLQIMKTCEALAEQGVRVELIIPDRQNPLKEDPFAFYAIKTSFTITRLPVWDLITNNYFGPLGFWIETYSFYRSIKKYLPHHPVDTCFTRDTLLADWLKVDLLPLYLELHTLPDNFSKKFKKLLERMSGLVVISKGIANRLISEGTRQEKIQLAPDAVDSKQFHTDHTQAVCRNHLQLPLDQKIIVYTGHLYEWKGANFLAEAALQLPEFKFYFVGGTANDMRRFSTRYSAPNIHYVSWQKNTLIPHWDRAADVVVLPTSGATKRGSLYTSPMKLFEYAMSGTPMVVSRLPAVEEIIRPDEAAFFTPDDSASLAQEIKNTVLNSAKITEAGQRLSDRIATEFSWAERAKKLRQFIFG